LLTLTLRADAPSGAGKIAAVDEPLAEPIVEVGCHGGPSAIVSAGASFRA
jgi:hypothetical protein